MKTLPLSQGKYAVVDDADFEQLSEHKWYAYKEIRKNRVVWYSVRNEPTGCVNRPQRTLQMHREILGVTDPLAKIDHINGDGLDNQRQNLRLATNRENCQNQHKIPGCSSHYKGVSWCKLTNKWKAQIRVNGHKQHIGLFETEELAAAAYDKRAAQEFGDFALLNSTVIARLARQTVARTS